MPTLTDFEVDGLQVRRAAAGGFTLSDDGEFTGRAVPYGVTIELFGLRERFEPGTFAAQVKDPGRVKIAYRHGEIIGRAVELDDRPDGLWVRGKILASEDRPIARQALADLRDNLVDELSVGFQQVRGGTVIEDDGNLVVHRRAALREISVVPWGAYSRKATITAVRSEPRPDAVLAELEQVMTRARVTLATTR